MIPRYIHEKTEWPHFQWNVEAVSGPLAATSFSLGRIVGRMEALGFGDRQETTLEALVQEVRKSSEIEGEHLDEKQVRSSVARRLGLDVAGLPPSDRHIEGDVEMVLDATQNHEHPLTADRLYGWHAALFPTGYSGMHKIAVGRWRDGEMQVVSGPEGRKRIHFEAPPSERVGGEMSNFLAWFEGDHEENGILVAALAHLWFVTIHPFDDGNGRIGRAIMDLALSRSEQRSWRCYSMSAQIQKERNAYYDTLENAQKGDLEITPYLIWFIQCLERSLMTAEETIAKALFRTRFWQAHAGKPLNDRQRKVVSLLLDSFFGKLTNKKWTKITNSSHDAAHRDMSDLLAKGILMRDGEVGRGAGYLLAPLPDGSRLPVGLGLIDKAEVEEDRHDPS